MPNMTGPQHADQLIARLNEATMVEAMFEKDVTGEASDGQVLTLFVAGPRNAGGYLIEVRHLDAERTEGMVGDVIASAERDAGWDPTP